VVVDGSQLQQALLNLVLNAEQAMRGRPTKRLQVGARFDENASAVELFVTDTGHGIDRANLSRIFDPFFTTRDVGEGTGLGLSICYGIIRDHGGQITVESVVNTGTTFSVLLPARVDEVASTEPVLIAHADQGERDYLAAALNGWGSRIVTAATSGDAIEIYSGSSFTGRVHRARRRRSGSAGVAIGLRRTRNPSRAHFDDRRRWRRGAVWKGIRQRGALAAISATGDSIRSSGEYQGVCMTGQPPLLIVVDDDQGILEIVERLARRNGFEVVACAGGMQALAELSTRHVDIALVDLRMPDLGGLDVIRAIRDMDPRCQAVLMTGFATVDTAVEAIKLGALDYLSKPLDLARLERLFTDVRDDTERRRGVLAMESEVARRLEFCGMVGRAPAMQELFGTVRRLAPHVRTALVTGETGTGKELVARALHRSGPRGDKRFVTVSCSAVIESLFDGEVFGYVRGAVSGAAEDRAGLFELADGGTLFLDEVGELPQSLQAKLLRVLETGEITRVGSVEARHVDLHVIASSNRDLRAEVAAGRFRSDLYYRLNVVEDQASAASRPARGHPVPDGRIRPGDRTNGFRNPLRD
jgi:ActR/RegA family two-component response regulator